MERTPITREGYEVLKAELQHLKAVERPKTIQAIEEARSHGDLSENAEYAAAKERQAFIEARTSDLEFKLASADIIDPGDLPKDRVVFGTSLKVGNLDTGEELDLQLVGPDESDANKGKISVTSPLGQALLGKRPGDVCAMNAPGGKREYELIEIV